MKLDKKDMLLYVVTDRTWLNQNTLEDQVKQAVLSGATFIQLREKQLDQTAFLKQAKAIKKITDQYHVPFVINDNVEIALAVNADGVHIGQKDMNARECRKKIGPEKILGVSVRTVQQAMDAEKDGADYIGVGAVFSTSTKTDAKTLSFADLASIVKSVSIPVVAIGGINQNNILQLRGSGIDGVAVVSAIFAQEDIAKATQEMLCAAKQLVNQTTK